LYSYGGGGQAVTFAVDAHGNVSYDPSLNEVLNSTLAHQLTVNGATVTIDARSLSDASVFVDSYIVEQTSAMFKLHLLPGTHTIRSLDGTRSITFTVDNSGNVNYDPSEDLILGGRGTKTLLIKSLA
jgi:hypothetical protein